MVGTGDDVGTVSVLVSFGGMWAGGWHLSNSVSSSPSEQVGDKHFMGSKWDELRVMLWPCFAVTMLLFFEWSCMAEGKMVVFVIFLCCLIRTKLSGWSVEGKIFLFLSVYSRIFCLLVLSFSEIFLFALLCGWFWVGGKMGWPIFIFLPVSASEGENLVDVWGLLQYIRKNVGSWDLHVCVLSAMHDLMFLLRVVMKCSTSPFVSGYRDVIFLCCMPKSCMELENYSLLKGGQLSVLIELGIPWCEKMASNFFRIVVTELDEIISTSGNRLNSSMTTSK